jgi:hypothetical protein
LPEERSRSKVYDALDNVIAITDPRGTRVELGVGFSVLGPDRFRRLVAAICNRTRRQ